MSSFKADRCKLNNLVLKPSKFLKINKKLKTSIQIAGCSGAMILFAPSVLSNNSDHNNSSILENRLV